MLLGLLVQRDGNSGEERVEGLVKSSAGVDVLVVGTVSFREKWGRRQNLV